MIIAMRCITAPIAWLVPLLILCSPHCAHSQTTDPDKLLKQADALTAQRYFTRAEAVYKQVLEQDEDNPDAHMGLGKLFHQKEDWGQAGDHFGEVLEHDRTNL